MAKKEASSHTIPKSIVKSTLDVNSASKPRYVGYAAKKVQLAEDKGQDTKGESGILLNNTAPDFKKMLPRRRGSMHA
jgi:hypothetical protein